MDNDYSRFSKILHNMKMEYLSSGSHMIYSSLDSTKNLEDSFNKEDFHDMLLEIIEQEKESTNGTSGSYFPGKRKFKFA